MSTQTISIRSDSDKWHRFTTSIAIHSRISAQHRLLIYVVELWLTILLLVGLVIGGAHLLSNTTAAATFGLARCDGIPCFRGLVPGRTAWATIIPAYTDETTIYDPTNTSLMMSRSADGVSLGAIYIRLYPHERVLIGEIVALYGTPCQVAINPEYGYLTLDYPLLHIEAHFERDRLNPDTPVQHITFRDPAAAESACHNPTPAPNGHDRQRSWRGFTSIQRYLSEANTGQER